MSNHSRLNLHVPEPEFRPGSRPDFSGVTIPRAGTVRKPPVDAAPEDIRDLAYSIIRVLNRVGEAVGPWAGELSDEALLAGLKTMMKVRAYDVPHADGAAAGQDVLLHAVHRRGGDRLRLPDGAREGRHEFPHLPPAGSADRVAATRSST